MPSTMQAPLLSPYGAPPNRYRCASSYTLDVVLSCKLNSYEMGEERGDLRFTYYCVSAYGRPGGKRNHFRE